MKTFIVLVAVLGLIGFLTPTARATEKPMSYDLNLILRAPVWSGQTGYINNYEATEFGGSLKLNNVIAGLPHFHPFVSGMHALGGWNSIFDAKNEVQAGFDYDLGNGLTFSAWDDEHFTKEINRVFVALKYGTHGLF